MKKRPFCLLDIFTESVLIIKLFPNNRVQNYRKFQYSLSQQRSSSSHVAIHVSQPRSHCTSRDIQAASWSNLFPLRPSIILIHCRRKSWCIRHGLGSALDMEAVKRLHGTSIFHVPSIRETRIVNQAILGFRYLLCRGDPVGFLITETVGFLH